MDKSGKKIGEILIEKGYVTEAQLHDALLEQKLNDKFVGMILKEKGYLADADLGRALAEQFGLPFVDLKEEHLDLEVTRKYSTALVVDHAYVPFREDEESVTVAVINPMDAVAMSKIEEEASPREVKLVMVSEQDIRQVIENYRRYINQNIQRLLKRPQPRQ